MKPIGRESTWTSYSGLPSQRDAPFSPQQSLGRSNPPDLDLDWRATPDAEFESLFE